jgi:hypothetical protein
LQRMLQKGRAGLEGEYSAGSPQRGQTTMRPAGGVADVLTDCRRSVRSRRRCR